MLIFGILWKTGYLRGQRNNNWGGVVLFGQCCVGVFFLRFGDMSSYNHICVTLMAKQQNGQYKTLARKKKMRG